VIDIPEPLEDVAERNPHISPDRIRRYTRLTRRLQEQGLLRRPKYNIDHPFATAHGRAERARIRSLDKDA